MDKAFDELLDIINGDDIITPADNNSNDNTLYDNIADDNIADDYDTQMGVAVDDVLKLVPIELRVEPQHEVIEVPEFDPKNNVLNLRIREEFRTECIFKEIDIFTSPVNTTNTMEGYLSNVSFHERDLIEELMPDDVMVLYKCNYGRVQYPGYVEPVKMKKTNRGRKKKEKKKKLRKKQGNGNEFNSQITFVVRTTVPKIVLLNDTDDTTDDTTDDNIDNDIDNIDDNTVDNTDDNTDDTTDNTPNNTTGMELTSIGVSPINDIPTINPQSTNGIILVPSNSKVYKFKVFRTGKIQLPGVHQKSIEDVIECTKKIVDVLNFHLHTGIYDPSKLTSLINLNPVMKNYKFAVKLPPKHIIDMDLLKRILFTERMEPNETAPIHPNIFMLKYTRQDTKLSVKFSTPVYKNPKKKTRINIFMRGKINILGAFDVNMTRQICTYLEWIFRSHYKTLIVPEGNVAQELPPLEPNIDNSDSDVILTQFMNWMPQLPQLTDNEYELAMGFIDSVYNDIYTSTNNFLHDYFAGTELECVF